MNVLMEVITAMTMLIVKILKGTIHVVANQVLAEMAFLVHVRNRFHLIFMQLVKIKYGYISIVIYHIPVYGFIFNYNLYANPECFLQEGIVCYKTPNNDTISD